MTPSHYSPSPPSGFSRREGGRAVAVALALALLAALPYLARGGLHTFITYDDATYVYQNRMVRDGLSPAGIRWAFVTFHAANWHPLTWISHMADTTLFGNDPWWHHWTSILLHALNSALLFAVLRAMTGTLWRSAAVAALFAVHPLHVQSVAWVSERKDVLSAMFWWLAMGAYARYAVRPCLLRYLIVAGMFALGLLSKPMVVTLPFVFLLLDWWPLGRVPGSPARPGGAQAPKMSVPFLLREKAPLLALSALSAFLTYRAQAGGSAVWEQPPALTRAGNALISYVKYLLMAVWPSKLAFFYPYPAEDLPWWQPAMAALFLAATTAAALRLAKRAPWFIVGWLWYLGTLVPVIGLVQVGRQAMADRYTYLPLTGVFIAAVWGLHRLAGGRRRAANTLAAAATAVIALLAAGSWQQVGYWRSGEALFSRALEVTRGNAEAHKHLGKTLFMKGDFGRAAEEYRAALRIIPEYAEVHSDLGAALFNLGERRSAISHFRSAVRHRPEFPEALSNLASALAAEGEQVQAIAAYRRALALSPDNPDIHNNLGVVLMRLGRMGEARESFSAALAIDPAHAGARFNLARLSGSAGAAARGGEAGE